MTEDFLPGLSSFTPLAITALVAVVGLFLVSRLPVREEDPAHPGAGRFRRQIALVVLAHLAALAVILALPVRDELRAQLVSLFGLIVTAIIALSSTTFVANAMAGLMLRSLGNFHAGDFIRVGDHFGRVTERGLLHSEIQTEDRDLVTLPNLFLITQPVRVVRASGTLVSCDLSLGYEIPRTRITSLLQEAAVTAELEDPFVRITELGDFAVGYRVSGFLAEVRRMVSARSALRGAVLDALHGAGIEIVSPGFMNQRQLDPTHRFIPAATPAAQSAEDDSARADAEALMFDKADTIARLGELQQTRERLRAEIAALQEGRPGTEHLEARRRKLELAWRERQLAALEETLAAAVDTDADQAGETDGAR
jgi:small-conductance mechanosensitive channel